MDVIGIIALIAQAAPYIEQVSAGVFKAIAAEQLAAAQATWISDCLDQIVLPTMTEADPFWTPAEKRQRCIDAIVAFAGDVPGVVTPEMVQQAVAQIAQAPAS